MKQLIIILTLTLQSFALHATPVAHVIQHGTDSGVLKTQSVREFTLDNQAPWIVMGSPDIYLQFFDQSTVPNGGETPTRNLSFRIPNQGSAHVVFKTVETFTHGVAYCISDNPLECSPAGNGPQVAGFILD